MDGARPARLPPVWRPLQGSRWAANARTARVDAAAVRRNDRLAVAQPPAQPTAAGRAVHADASLARGLPSQHSRRARNGTYGRATAVGRIEVSPARRRPGRAPRLAPRPVYDRTRPACPGCARRVL